MKRNQLILLIVLLAAVGGAGLMLYKRENQSWDGSDVRLGQKLIKDFPLNDVSHIAIKNSGGDLNLIKKDDEWTVQERGNYPANFSQIQTLLRKVWEMKVAQPQNVSAAQLPRFELQAPGKSTNSATLVEFRGAGDKPLQSLLLGKKHMRQSGGNESPFGGGGGWPDGRYVMVGDNVKTVALVNDAMAEIEPKPEPWLNKDFLKVEKIKSVSITDTNATNNWALTRESEATEFKFGQAQAAEELDKAKAASAGTALTSPSFDDVVAPGAKTDAELGLDHPRVATIETFDHLTYKVSIGNTNAEGNYYFKVDVSADLPKERTPGKDEKPEDKEKLDKEFKEQNTKTEEKLKNEEKLEKWTFVVSKWTIDPLLKDRKDLIAVKTETPPSTPPGLNNINTPPGKTPATPVIPFLPDDHPNPTGTSVIKTPPVTPPATPPRIEIKPPPPLPPEKPAPSKPPEKPAEKESEKPAEKAPETKPPEPAPKPPAEAPKPEEKKEAPVPL